MLTKKSGELVAIADHAVHDYFAEADIVEVTLRQEDGTTQQARLVVGAKCAYTKSPIAMHDYIEIGWDYSMFYVRILVQDARRQFIPTEIPVTAERTFHVSDLLDSLGPKETD